MSTTRMTTIERAFQLAKEGSCRSVADIRAQLENERYEGVFGHLSGLGIKRQLAAILAARGMTNASDDDD